jgi:hypothetical protein
MRIRGVRTITVLIIALAGSGLAHAGEPATILAQGKETPCMCRGNGTFYETGQMACLRTVDGPRLATCGMVLNNTSWKFSDRPCPNS